MLDCIRTYLMSLLPIPTNIVKQLSKIRSDFSWEDGSVNRKYHLVKWTTVIHHKKVGGLGVRNQKLHNKEFAT
uniref:Putative ovule protein n=1 Tax=Solanum chacoense TaxID=4108 RepID=A0A0V0IJF4_SOLCH